MAHLIITNISHYRQLDDIEYENIEYLDPTDAEEQFENENAIEQSPVALQMM